MFLKHLTEGLVHIEDLPVLDFLETIKKINEFEITEKIDGANIIFGFDENGKFYTSREMKGGKRFYNEKDYPLKFWTTGFRSAHLALEKVLFDILNKIVYPGDSFVAEILFGELPNTVPYKGDENQVVLLNPFSAQKEKEKLQDRFEKLVDYLKGKRVEVVLDVPFTDDGKTIRKIAEKHVWLFDVTPRINPNIIDKEHLRNVLEKKIRNIENYLSHPSNIKGLNNIDIISIPLNRKPNNIERNDWEILKEKIKEEKNRIKDQIMQMKLNIKEDLLNHFVRNLESKFGPKFEEGGWIEGVVFRDRITGKSFKLVDKDIFTELNKFNWKVRSLLKDSNLSKKTGSYFSKIVSRISNVLGYKPIELRNKIKNRERIEINKPVDEVKNKIKEILTKAIKALDAMLEYYKRNRNRIKIYLEKIDRTFEYTNAQHRKTLETFAEFRADLEEMLKQLDKGKNIEDVVFILFSGKEKLVEKRYSRNLLKEGGNVFPETVKIEKSKILPTLENLSKDLDIPFEILKNNLLGSAFVKQISSDIDIALPESMYDEIKQKVKNSNYAHKILSSMIHLKYPVAGTKDHVQIDLIFGDVNWLKSYYVSPIEEEFKGAHLNSLLGSIAKFLDRKVSEEKIDGIPVRIERWRYSPKDGLIRIISEIRTKDGKPLKNRKDTIISPEIKDKNKIAKILLGNDAKAEDLKSIKRIMELLRKNRKNIVDDVMKEWKESMESRNLYKEIPW
jgi:hypothetical protein